MKKFWNIFLLATLIIAVALTLWLNYLAGTYIGEITYDEKLDTSALTICNPNFIPQYYSTRTDFTGGKKAIKKKLMPLIEANSISFGSKNGYITFRFIVNCNGEIGLFRVNEIDKNLDPTAYAIQKVEKLKEFVSTLKDWEVPSKNGKKYDSYYLINFKIENGTITDIF